MFRQAPAPVEGDQIADLQAAAFAPARPAPDQARLAAPVFRQGADDQSTLAVFASRQDIAPVMPFHGGMP